MHDPEQVNAVKCQPLDGDDHPTQITAYQAQKCAAIVEAYADGQALYREHVNTVAKFLKTAALEAALGHGCHFQKLSARISEGDVSYVRSAGRRPDGLFRGRRR